MRSIALTSPKTASNILVAVPLPAHLSSSIINCVRVLNQSSLFYSCDERYTF